MLKKVSKFCGLFIAGVLIVSTAVPQTAIAGVSNGKIITGPGPVKPNVSPTTVTAPGSARSSGSSSDTTQNQAESAKYFLDFDSLKTLDIEAMNNGIPTNIGGKPDSVFNNGDTIYISDDYPIEEQGSESYNAVHRLADLAKEFNLVLNPATTKIPDKLFEDGYGLCGLSSILSDYVTDIGNAAFHNCEYLEHINMMPNVVSIGDRAFCDCQWLESVNFPEATSLGYGVFSSCDSLESVNFPKMKGALSDGIGYRHEGVFFNCIALKYVDMPQVASIGSQTFYGCSSLQSIDMPKVTNVSEHAFGGCSSLESIHMPDLITVGQYAFYECPLLYLNLPNVDWLH